MKRRYITTTLLAALVAIGTASCSKQAEVEAGKQTMCPVMRGQKINPNLYADVNGKRIYVCCPGCIVKIKADPEKYIAQLEAEGIVLDKTPQQADDSGHENEHGDQNH
ncbi:MAG TPA: hypothetical protein VLL07_00230 [Pontiella sp.]|nr:hypothetical protein [Pontiella sp.]